MRPSLIFIFYVAYTYNRLPSSYYVFSTPLIVAVVAVCDRKLSFPKQLPMESCSVFIPHRANCMGVLFVQHSGGLEYYMTLQAVVIASSNSGSFIMFEVWITR